MAKMELNCPHCGKGKVKIETDESRAGALSEVKGLNWFQLLRQTGPNEWSDSTTNGLGFQCKCGKAFFAYNVDTPEPAQVTPVLKEGLLGVWLCEKCGEVFAANPLTCPKCGTQYSGGA